MTNFSSLIYIKFKIGFEFDYFNNLEVNDYFNASCSETIEESLIYTHTGSDLNDASLTILDTIEDCCALCRETYGLNFILNIIYSINY